MTTRPTVGSVLVLGGGVGGMQAALDLADSGYKVYLAEKESSIGGTMAQLDKTFPSNDCAMCIMAPRLVNVGRHLNIELLPNTELLALDGEAGHFRATLDRKGTWIDPTVCTGCGECAEACPVELPNEFNLGLAKRKAVSRRYPQAVPASFSISKAERPPCQNACTAGVNVQGYVALISRGRFAEAVELVRRQMPLLSVCGRICVHRCEQECNRGVVDEPVAVMNLKRFLADWDLAHQTPFEPPVLKTKDDRVAVIGAGPAGLTCAHDLAKRGYAVTLFESAPEIGGMLRACIPEFRLPGYALERDLDYLLSPGISVHTGMKLGKDFTLESLEEEGYRALFLATGALRPKSLPIPGHDLAGIALNLDFLRNARAHEAKALSGNVLVLGGGNVAIDCARTARRLGADRVTMACLESRKTMPSHEWEIQQAIAEGIEIINDVTFKRFIGETRVAGVEARRISAMKFDAEGRLAVTEIPESDFIIAADHVIVAIGQSPDVGYLAQRADVAVSRRGLLEIDPDTQAAIAPANGEHRMRIFAGGDVVTGTAFVVDAVGAGHRAADAMSAYLEALPFHAKPRREPPRLSPEAAEKKIERHQLTPTPRTPMRTRRVGAVLDFAELEVGYSEQEAIAEAKRCLNCGLCSECGQCASVCQAGAINHHISRAQTKTIDVGAVILAPGLRPYDPEEKGEYGYRRYPNVVTSLEFERILSPSGPFAGKVLRPSDGAPPKRIAFIQCVGSREAGRNYCSSVCCMYTAKQALIAKEHQGGELDCTVFYIDLRAVSKGFESYIDRAKHEGVRYVRCRPSSVRSLSNGNLVVDFADDSGRPAHEEFDMVVLAVALTPDATKQLARTAGVAVDEFGFCRTTDFAPSETSREGVFVCGAFADPIDIPETVASASAAASEAMRLLADSRGTLVRPKEYPPEKDVTGEDPRVGVFVCHCGTNIAGVVDVESVVQYAKGLPNVAHAERNLYTCSDDTQKRIREKIGELGLNRIVVASCTPRTHEALFQDTVREAGLNPYFFELANIRDQCSWVHMKEKQKATAKAKDLVRMAIAKVRLDAPLHKRPLAVTGAALVVGGGPAGMTAAVTLADQGYKVLLLEKELELGGHARDLRSLLNGDDAAKQVANLIGRTVRHPNIELLLSSELVSVSGSLGNFESVISTRGVQRDIRHGVVILATGAERYVPDENLYGIDPRVVRNFELDSLLATRSVKTDSVAFIQCVGSRSAQQPWCSRTCCSDSVKHALSVKQQNPDAAVAVFYRDIRTYGVREKYYRLARERGVRFIRCAEDRPPEVAKRNGALRITAIDQMAGREVAFDATAVVLAAATLPNRDNKQLAQILKVPLSEDGFFLEAHRKLRPVDFANDGIFLCGAAHSPVGLREAMAQAAGAAARAATILSKNEIQLEPTISHIVTEKCDGCAYCVGPCPFHAMSIVEYDENGTTKKRAQVDEAVCKGCGTCQATCPKDAVYVSHFRPEQLRAEIAAALERAE